MNHLLQVIKNIKGLLQLKGASEEQIVIAETALGLQFAADYKLYLKEFGCIAFGSHEFTGLNTSERLSVLAVTNFERKSKKQVLPSNMYVVETVDDGVGIILQNESGEVYVFHNNSGKCKRIFSSLASYIESLS